MARHRMGPEQLRAIADIRGEAYDETAEPARVPDPVFELERFDDGVSVARYGRAGDILQFGPDGNVPYASSFNQGGIRLAIFHTAAGGRYGLGQGLVYDYQQEEFWGLASAETLPDLVLGHPWQPLGEMAAQEPVVEAQFKARDDSWPGETLSTENPFVELADLLEDVRKLSPYLEELYFQEPE